VIEVFVIDDHPNVKWLFGEMQAATHMGVLFTIQTVIKLEVETGEEYTKDATLMQQLRSCWKQNEDRLVKEKANEK
jgi:hypothetical protein